MLDKETKQRINSARQILVGKVPDPKAQVEQITNALIYKFMDDMDRENEELGGKAGFLTGGLKEFSWGRLMSGELSGLERWDLYTRALSSFAKSKQIPELFRTIFKDAYLPYRDPETLNLFLKEINAFSYSNSENLGNAFEYLLSILGSQGDAGQFRTPRHIIDFIVEVVNPQKTDRILDPACGTAGFLISSYKHIRRENSSNYKADDYTPTFAESESADIAGVEIQKNGKFRGDKLTPDDRKRLANNIVGYDISPDMVRLSLVNLYLHGFSTPQIHEYDTLTYEERWGDNFDIILANPPFMTPKGGIRPHKGFQVSANRAEVLFVDYIAEHLTIHGKAGIIVPEGIIFQSANAYKDLRKMLVEEHYLYAVVSLPAGVFQPYSGVKTSIFFLDRTIAKQNDEILFVKVENDGFDLGAQRRRIEKNDLPRAFEILQNWQKGEKAESKLALWVKKKKIAENGDYNLTGDRYRETVDYSKVKWPMVRLGEVCEINPDSSNPAELFGEKEFVYIDISSIENNGGTISYDNLIIADKAPSRARRIVRENDVLISTVRPNLKAFAILKHLPDKVIASTGFAVLRSSSTIIPDYLFRIIFDDSVMEQMIGAMGKGAYPSINQTDVKNLIIPLPPLEVQKEIARELDSCQKVIDGARQVAENWKPRIRINPDWPMVKLGEVSNLIGGGTPSKTKKEFWENGNIKWISARHIDENSKIVGFDLITEEAVQHSSTKIVPEREIVFVTRVSVGKIAIANSAYAINQDLTGIITDKNKSISEYIFRILQQKVEGIQAKAQGLGVKGITRKEFANTIIPLPPLDTQKQIVAKIEKEQKMVEECKKLIAIHERKIRDKIAEVWGEK